MHNIQKTAIYATYEDGVLNITGCWERWFG